MLIDTQAIPPASPLLDTVFFYLFALLTLAGALLTITRRNAVHSAISAHRFAAWRRRALSSATRRVSVRGTDRAVRWRHHGAVPIA